MLVRLSGSQRQDSQDHRHHVITKYGWLQSDRRHSTYGRLQAGCVGDLTGHSECPVVCSALNCLFCAGEIMARIDRTAYNHVPALFFEKSITHLIHLITRRPHGSSDNRLSCRTQTIRPLEPIEQQATQLPQNRPRNHIIIIIITMKVTAVATLLFATLALASPAPVAQPDAEAAAAIAEPLVFEARAPEPLLEARKKAKKPKGSSNNTNSSATSLTPSRVLQLGAVGLGVMEVVRLWG